MPILLTILIHFGYLNAFPQENNFRASFFPLDNEIEGWILKDSVHIYSSKNLYLQVGELSGLYNEYGIIRSMESIYTGLASARIIIELFESSDTQGAWGLFTVNAPINGSWLDLGDIALRDEYSIHFVKGNIYVQCTSTDFKANASIIQFGEFISNNIPGHSKKPTAFQAFDFEDIEVDEERYFQGQIGLNEVFDFGHGSIAGFKHGAASKFMETRFFVFTYSDERKRREWFASTKGKMRMDQNQRFFNYELAGEGFSVNDRWGNLWIFKPHGKCILVVMGFERHDADLLFEEMIVNLGGS